MIGPPCQAWKIRLVRTDMTSGAHGKTVQCGPLEVFHVGGGDVDEVVVWPGDEGEGAGVRLGEHVSDERLDLVAVVGADPDGHKCLQRDAERGGVQLQPVAADDAGAAEPVDAVQARTSSPAIEDVPGEAHGGPR